MATLILASTALVGCSEGGGGATTVTGKVTYRDKPVAGAAVAFYLGYYAVGYALGSFLIVLAGVNVATGFCVPSFIYGLVFGVEECEAEELKNSEKKIESVSPLWPK